MISRNKSLCSSLAFFLSVVLLVEPLLAQSDSFNILGKGDTSETVGRSIGSGKGSLGGGLQLGGQGNQPQTSFFGGSTVTQFPQSPLEGPLKPEEYIVGAGDVFGIDFWGVIRDSVIAGVDVESHLFIPKVGTFNVQNKNLAYVRDEVSRAVSATFPKSKFRVSLIQPRSFKVFVQGAVSIPGIYITTQLNRLSDVLANAGGVSPTGSRAKVRIERGKQVLVANLEKFFREGQLEFNPRLQDGDRVFVPYPKEFVVVSGAVNSPGIYELLEGNETGKDLITRAYGVSDKADRTKLVHLMREGERGELNKLEMPLDEVLKLPLRAGDEISIPSDPLHVPLPGEAVYVTGEVKVPGAKPYKPNDGVWEYLATAGGPSPRAKYSKAVVRKKDGREFAVNDSPSIDPGDIIYVPEVGMKFWQDHLLIVTTLLTILTTTLAIQQR